MIEYFTFYGKSGEAYQFEVYPIGTEFKNLGGVYIFTNRKVDHERNEIIHTLLYIGITDSFSHRIKYHEKLSEVEKHNGNCICVYQEPNEIDREHIEGDLLNNYNTKLNSKQLKRPNRFQYTLF